MLRSHAEAEAAAGSFDALRRVRGGAAAAAAGAGAAAAAAAAGAAEEEGDGGSEDNEQGHGANVGIWRGRCQATVAELLQAASLPTPWLRIRQKLHRWELGNPRLHAVLPALWLHRTPAWQARRSWWLLRSLAGLAPPRVLAAAYSTLWNRWTTARRFQGTARCLLGCGVEHGDSIEHYCRCSVTREVCDRTLALDPERLANMQAFLLASAEVDDESTLLRMGLLHYGL